MQEKTELLAGAIEYVPENYFRPLDFKAVFDRAAPLHVDIGCGDGTFLSALAPQNPHHNFLGIERMPGRVRTACRKIAQANPGNARVIQVESSYAITYLLPESSVTTFYLLFPDPWPKRRHQQRRVVNAEFLQSLHRALAPDGWFIVATDERDYFREIEQLTERSNKFTREPLEQFDFPRTTFEKHFRDRGLEIYRLGLRKVSPVR